MKTIIAGVLSTVFIFVALVMLFFIGAYLIYRGIQWVKRVWDWFNNDDLNLI